MTWQFSFWEVAAGVLVGLLMSRLVFIRALAVTPGSTRRRVLVVGGALVLIGLVLWLGLSDVGDAVMHAVSRRVRHTGIDGAVYIALNVVVIDTLVTALMRTLGRDGTGRH